MFESIMGFGIIGLLIMAILWWLPVILILRSDKTHGGEKLVWILLILFFSWFSWIIYALIAPLSKR